MSYFSPTILEGEFGTWVLQTQTTTATNANQFNFYYITNDGLFVFLDGTASKVRTINSSGTIVSEANTSGLGLTGSFASGRFSVLGKYFVLEDAVNSLLLRVYKNGVLVTTLLQGGILSTSIEGWCISSNGEWIGVFDSRNPSHYAVWRGT